ncbi:MAG TPA: hypothetical protein DDW76_23730 [Cyanobacteria bacterium UBA11369]|nr:hypothetical protein [Cyanobacteria bacterium UBA11371]HBE30624.1 hypothetical protein [Cyanobacteria bacterium UBA11368]HBE51702.1 hypothetical protein [Cyanobacteria bacterium UBA11369]
MVFKSIWLAGSSRSGKTTRLVEHFCAWMQSVDALRRGASSRRRVQFSRSQWLSLRQTPSGVLAFAANGDNRIELADRIAVATGGKYAVQTTTPLGFFQDEVILFWPLLIQRLNLRSQFPIRLRPETEQELATALWRAELDAGIWQETGVSEYRQVRRALDLLLLAGASGTPIEAIQGILEAGYGERESDEGQANQEEAEIEEEDAFDTLFPIQEKVRERDKIQKRVGELLLRWRNWCLERGFLTYGLIYELYWRYLLPDKTYQQYLTRRYRLILADDVDDYPAIARHLFDFFLNNGAVGAFTYNPNGGVRVGLGADPDYMAELASRCQVETLNDRPVTCLDETLGMQIVEAVSDPAFLLSLPRSVQSMQSISRAQILRQTAKAVAVAVKSGQVQPQEVAIIAPGLDAIARYTLVEILISKGIPVESLNDQRPLSSSPIIRALLTLLAFVYPGLGRLVDRDAVAEMLVVLSTRYDSRIVGAGVTKDNLTNPAPVDDQLPITNYQSPLTPNIDPVRAGLLTDYCFEPNSELPNLLPVKVFSRWDRLGYEATKAYEGILKWLEEQRSQQEARLIPSFVHVLDRAIQRFLWNGSYLPFEQLSALRELLETAQHYWEVDGRMRSQSDLGETPSHTTVGRFIQMLRRGTVTAKPYPVRAIGPGSNAVTLATIFQYRSSRKYHRWQFWLDAGSPLWLSGGVAALFGAPLFLQNRVGLLWTEEDALIADEERLRRILRDLLGRAGERVYLCHSEMATNGQEQTGPLLALINAAIPATAKEETALI